MKNFTSKLKGILKHCYGFNSTKKACLTVTRHDSSIVSSDNSRDGLEILKFFSAKHDDSSFLFLMKNALKQHENNYGDATSFCIMLILHLLDNDVFPQECEILEVFDAINKANLLVNSIIDKEKQKDFYIKTICSFNEYSSAISEIFLKNKNKILSYSSCNVPANKLDIKKFHTIKRDGIEYSVNLPNNYTHSKLRYNEDCVVFVDKRNINEDIYKFYNNLAITNNKRVFVFCHSYDEVAENLIEENMALNCVFLKLTISYKVESYLDDIYEIANIKPDLQNKNIEVGTLKKIILLNRNKVVIVKHETAEVAERVANRIKYLEQEECDTSRERKQQMTHSDMCDLVFYSNCPQEKSYIKYLLEDVSKALNADEEEYIKGSLDFSIIENNKLSCVLNTIRNLYFDINSSKYNENALDSKNAIKSAIRTACDFVNGVRASDNIEIKVENTKII